MPSAQFADLLVEATVLGTPYRRLLCYDVLTIESVNSLKVRVLDDLKVAGELLESDCEVVLRNYRLLDYDSTQIASDSAKSCALSDQDTWSGGHARQGRLLAATPSPKIPVEPSNENRHTMLAIASRQLYDRARGSGAVLPLEARVKPAATTRGFLRSSVGEGADQSLEPCAVAAGDVVAYEEGIAAPAVESPTFEITVRDFRGRSHAARVCGRSSVQHVKQGIAAALGCSVFSHWRLCHQGRPLAENLELDDYNLGPGSVIDIVLTSQHAGLLPRGPHQVTSTSSSTALALSSGSSSSVAGGSGKDTQAAALRLPGAAAGTAGGQSMGANAAGTGSSRSSSSSGGGQGPAGDQKGTGAQLAVQVLLPCGRVVNVNRWASDDPQQFTSRVLEAEKALLTASPTRQQSAAAAAVGATATVGKPAAAQSAVVGGDPAAVATPAVAAGSAGLEGAQGKTAAGKGDTAAATEARKGGEAGATVSPAVAVTTDSFKTARMVARGSPWGVTQGKETMQLPGVLGQKLVALLLAAAAVVMAVAFM